MAKRGMSAVITTLIIILLTIVVLGILWVVVKNVINNQKEKISLTGLVINLKIQKAFINNTNLSVMVKRGPGSGNISGINFIMAEGDNSVVVEENSVLRELDHKIFNFDLNKLNMGLVKKVSIAPVYILESGKEFKGNVVDTFEFTNKEIIKDLGGVSWWGFEKNVLDILGNNNGIVEGADCSVNGKYGKACSFDNTDIKINNDPSFNNFGTAFSVSAWVKPFSWNSYNTVVGQESGFLLTTDSSGKLHNWIYADGSWNDDVSYNPSIPLNKWSFLVLTYNGTKIKSYFNGVSQGPGQDKTGAMMSNENIYIGNRPAHPQPFHGVIDEPIIFKRALTEKEVKSLYELDLTKKN